MRLPTFHTVAATALINLTLTTAINIQIGYRPGSSTADCEPIAYIWSDSGAYKGIAFINSATHLAVNPEPIFEQYPLFCKTLADSGYGNSCPVTFWPIAGYTITITGDGNSAEPGIWLEVAHTHSGVAEVRSGWARSFADEEQWQGGENDDAMFWIMNLPGY